jgi:hypothetical protein
VPEEPPAVGISSRLPGGLRGHRIGEGALINSDRGVRMRRVSISDSSAMATPARKVYCAPTASHTIPPTTGTITAAMWLMVCPGEMFGVISSGPRLMQYIRP